MLSSYQADRDFREEAQWIELFVERYRENPKFSIDRGGVEQLLSFYREFRKDVYQGGKHQEMHATKIDTKTINQRAC